MPQQNVHASQEEIDTWRKAAALAGSSFNGWVRKALTERAQLEAALERERKRHEQVPSGRDAASLHPA